MIDYHNAGADNQKRGNILVWEQPLTDRLRGEPLVLDARMRTQSILSSTLWLFGATTRGGGADVRDCDLVGQAKGGMSDEGRESQERQDRREMPFSLIQPDYPIPA